jgi:hypothetical protein
MRVLIYSVQWPSDSRPVIPNPAPGSGGADTTDAIPSPARLILGIGVPNFNSTDLRVAVIKADLGEVSLPGIVRAGVPSMGRSSFTTEGKVRRAILGCLVIDSPHRCHGRQLRVYTLLHNPTPRADNQR